LFALAPSLLAIHSNNAIVILASHWVARYRYQHGFIWWYCICVPWDQSS